MTYAARHTGLPLVPGTSLTAQDMAWRRRQLLAAGFDVRLADELTRAADLDLHALLELVDRGCPPRLAVRILGPVVLGGGG